MHNMRRVEKPVDMEREWNVSKCCISTTDIKTSNKSSDVSLYIRRELVGNGVGTFKYIVRRVSCGTRKTTLPGSRMFLIQDEISTTQKHKWTAHTCARKILKVSIHARDQINIIWPTPNVIIAWTLSHIRSWYGRNICATHLSLELRVCPHDGKPCTSCPPSLH